MSLFVALFLSFVILTSAQGAELEFSASIDRARVGQADPIRLTLTIKSGESISHLPAPQIALAQFDVEGPSISTRVEMLNFETTFARDLVYSLYAKKTGRLTIGPARIDFQGRRYVTKALSIEVVPGTLLQAPQGSSGDRTDQNNLADNLFVRTTVDRRKVYVGQQATLEFDLCYRFQLQNVGFKEIPTYSGFWAKELFSARELQPRREQINGLPFNVAPLKKVALFPTVTGIHSIEPISLSCEIPQRRRRGGFFFDDFDDFFGRSSQALVLRGEMVEIQVLPLPDRGRPDDFTGTVGRFGISADGNPRSVPAGDPVTLRIQVAGRGNIDGIKPPDLSNIDGFKVYDPTAETAADVDSGIYGGSRRFEYILIPERSGNLRIPPISFVHFDPELVAYRRISTAPIQIQVAPGTASEQVANYGLSRKAIQQVGSDIRHIKPDLRELETAVVYYESSWFWLFQIAMPATFVLLFLYQRRHKRLSGDLAYMRRRGARTVAQRRLNAVPQMQAAGQAVEIHAEIQRIVSEYIADLLNLNATGLTRDEIVAVLETAGVSEKITNRVCDLLSRCEFARFAPAGASAKDAEEVEEATIRLVDALDKEI